MDLDKYRVRKQNFPIWLAKHSFLPGCSSFLKLCSIFLTCDLKIMFKYQLFRILSWKMRPRRAGGPLILPRGPFFSIFTDFKGFPLWTACVFCAKTSPGFSSIWDHLTVIILLLWLRLSLNESYKHSCIKSSFSQFYLERGQIVKNEQKF